ncbi:hypothetical protein [Rhodococcus tibetensis]|uniref:Ig-like domain-containing protein n=1 Tax=Rhodococcus tibetensis TaxID=2965064 RepID=A0ABT1QM97_9NOCA|nr:hypothetical protein [Rhodococcus sp. FXJ9.536]MCQ4122773.1 hypothetical protein [Rhodococcus sp. FXJ9.536]
MDDTALLICATTAQYPYSTGATIDLTATGRDCNPDDPPIWEKEVPVARGGSAAQNQQCADDALISHGYRRTGQWMCSSELTGYPSWTTEVTAI